MWAPNQYDGYPFKKGRFGHRGTQGECHVSMADIRVMCLQDKKRPRLPKKFQKLGERCGTDSLLKPVGKTRSASNLITDV